MAENFPTGNNDGTDLSSPDPNALGAGAISDQIDGGMASPQTQTPEDITAIARDLSFKLLTPGGETTETDPVAAEAPIDTTEAAINLRNIYSDLVLSPAPPDVVLERLAIARNTTISAGTTSTLIHRVVDDYKKQIIFPNTSKGVGYISYDDKEATDSQTGLRPIISLGDYRTALYNKDKITPLFTFEPQKGKTRLAAMAAWAGQFFPAEQVAAKVAEIEKVVAQLQANKGLGSNFLYYHTVPLARIETGSDGKPIVSIGVETRKNYDGEDMSCGFDGLRAAATPEMLAEFSGVIDRKLKLAVPYESVVLPTEKELEAELFDKLRSAQDAELDGFKYTTTEFEGICKQDLVDAGIIAPASGEEVHELPPEQKEKIKSAWATVRKLNDAHNVVANGGKDRHEIHRAYGETNQNKWERSHIKKYIRNPDGTVTTHKVKPEAPQDWAPHLDTHTFSPKNQARAGELVDNLANKERRAKNVAAAQQILRN